MSEVFEGLRVRQKQARNSGILEAAWALLSERGYVGWTLTDLAERAGVSRRTLYLHFSSKEEIAAETVAKNLLRSADRIRSFAGTDPASRLKAVVRWFVDRGAEPHVIPVGPIKAEPGLMATVRTFPAYQEAYAALTAALAEVVADAQKAGAVTKRHPPETLAALVMQLLRGVDASRWKESADLADLAVATVFEGIGGAS
jgi:AcrR family transcriptional regulator